MNNTKLKTMFEFKNFEQRKRFKIYCAMSGKTQSEVFQLLIDNLFEQDTFKKAIQDLKN